MGVKAGCSSLSHSLLPYSISSSQKVGSPFCLYTFTRRKPNGGALVSRFTLSGTSKSKGFVVVQACSASLDESSDDELFGRMNNDDDDADDDHNRAVSRIFENSTHSEDDNSMKMGFSPSFSSSKLGSFRPSWLEALADPPNWPGRDEIERKASRFDIPLSSRIIKRKQEWEDGVTKAVESAYCSVKKAFSSMVFIIRELHSYTLKIKETLYCEDLQEILNRVHRELHASFVWLFQQVFSKTPTLMVYVMILLANFTVYSMVDDYNSTNAATPIIRETFSMTETETENQQQPSSESCPISKGSSPTNLQSNAVADKIGNEELTAMEVKLWNSMVAESKDETLDDETIQQLVSPVSVELEADDYMEYLRTDLLYQMRISEEPGNPLLLCNYGRFLYLVNHDHDRAEECFKRAVAVEPPDAEALNQYANFLWLVRKDMWEAEERFLEAMAAEPGSSYHISNYAAFLWSTGAEDTCFPPNPSNKKKGL